MVQVQLVVLASVMLIAFFNYLLCVRSFSHLSFLLQTDGNPRNTNVDPENLLNRDQYDVAKRLMVKATVHYAVGMTDLDAFVGDTKAHKSCLS